MVLPGLEAPDIAPFGSCFGSFRMPLLTLNPNFRRPSQTRILSRCRYGFLLACMLLAVSWVQLMHWRHQGLAWHLYHEAAFH